MNPYRRTGGIRTRLSQEINRLLSGCLPGEVEKQHDNGTTPVFSIVIPSLNQGRFLERSILSVINQGYPRTELIIIDGGSSDSTLDVIRRYQGHISSWVSEPDRGQSNALNKGFSMATGDIYGWLNSDDLYLPETFSRVARIFARHPEIQVVYGHWCAIDEQDLVTDVTYCLPPRSPRFHYENLNAYNQSMFWRRGAHRRLGGFDERLHRIMDNDMIIRLLLNEGPSRFYRLEEFLGAFRVYPGQKTNAVYIDEVQRAEERLLEEKFGFARRNSLRGMYYRLSYRLLQLRCWMHVGGPAYVLEKIEQGYKRRKGFF